MHTQCHFIFLSALKVHIQDDRYKSQAAATCGLVSFGKGCAPLLFFVLFVLRNDIAKCDTMEKHGVLLLSFL